MSNPDPGQPMPTPVDVGPVGCGCWGKTQARQPVSSPGLKLVAVAEVDTGLRSAMAAVLQTDMRDHSHTSASLAPYRLAQRADDEHALLQHLGVARTRGLGLSMGGRVGQMLTLRQPQVLNPVLLADTAGQVTPTQHRSFKVGAVCAAPS